MKLIDEKAVNAPRSPLEVKFTALTPGRKYKFIVVAVSGVEKSRERTAMKTMSKPSILEFKSR